jgi:hypothetical protein
MFFRDTFFPYITGTGLSGIQSILLRLFQVFISQ